MTLWLITLGCECHNPIHGRDQGLGPRAGLREFGALPSQAPLTSHRALNPFQLYCATPKELSALVRCTSERPRVMLVYPYFNNSNAFTIY